MKFFQFKKPVADRIVEAAAAPASVASEPVKNLELHQQLAELERERDEVLKACAPLEIQRDEAWRQVAFAQATAKAIGERIVALETPRYREVCNMIVVLKRALGKTVSLSAGTGNYS